MRGFEGNRRLARADGGCFACVFEDGRPSQPGFAPDPATPSYHP